MEGSSVLVRTMFFNLDTQKKVGQLKFPPRKKIGFGSSFPRTTFSLAARAGLNKMYELKFLYFFYFLPTSTVCMYLRRR